MPLTSEEQNRLKGIEEKIGAATNEIGNALRDGSVLVARSAVRNIRSWLEDIEKALELNGHGKKPS